jgi:hypothetical protein
MGIRSRTATVLGATVAALALGVGTAFAGPTYPFQNAQTSVDSCANRIGGGTAGGAYAGQFEAYETNGAGCTKGWVDLVYLDNYNNIQSIRRNTNVHAGSTAIVYIFLKQSQYRQIIGVSGAATSIQGHQTPVANLNF